MISDPLPDALLKRFTGPADGFWRAWTQAEVVAKLTRTPIVTLAQAGLPAPLPPGVVVHHGQHGQTHYCVGMHRPTVAVVVLSMGNRPHELARALETLHQQVGVEQDVVLVGNGWTPTDVPDWVRTVSPPDNVGVPEGRNIGARHARGDLIFFYDDDGELPTPETLAHLVDAMGPGIAVVQPRGVDPTGRPSPRRWVPRLRTSDANGAGDTVVFWEAMAIIRREAFEEVGGWPGEFFFGHEGIDLAMRLLDAGWRIRYEPAITVHHPAHPPSRHAVFYRTNARNRAWVARRNLPIGFAASYLLVWIAATVLRVRHPGSLRVWFSGLLEGLRGPVPGGRHPLRWRTIWRMTLLGRPPLW
ncbi:MAG: glycosyltransferase family 2 protein [Arachnia sp.]